MSKGKTVKTVAIVVALMVVINVSTGLICEKLAVKSIYNYALELVEENYENIHSVFGDKIPDKDEYIDRVREVYGTVHPYAVPMRFRRFSPLTNGTGGLFIYEGRKLYVEVYTLRYSVKDPSDDMAETMLHELRHADDQEPIRDRFGYNSYEMNVFGEGASSFWGSYPTLKNFSEGAYGEISADDYVIKFGSTGYMYSAYQMEYEMILALTDSETIHQYSQTCDSKVIKNKIRENYDVDFDLNYFWNNVFDFPAVRTEDRLRDQMDVFINSCLIQDVERISSREDAFRMLNLYRFLKTQVIPRCYRNDTHVYCTNDFVDIETLESALFDKVNEFGLFDELTADAAEQRFIFDCLTYMPEDSTEHMSREIDERFYDFTYTPLSLSGQRAVFNAEAMTLQLLDPEYDEPYAQYVYGGLYESTSPDDYMAIEPVEGTQMTF